MNAPGPAPAEPTAASSGGPAPAQRPPRLGWLPNALTIARLLALPVLWTLALLGLTLPLAIGTALASATDVVDGALARRLGVANRLGGALDSVADHLLSASLLIWLVMLRPEFFREQRLPLVLWAVFALVVIAAGYVKFRQVGNLHLYSAKAAGFSGYVLGIYVLATGTAGGPVFVVVMGLLWIAGIESLLVILTRDHVRDHAGTILRPRPPPRAGAGGTPTVHRHGAKRPDRR